MRARWGWKPQPVRADRAQAEGRGGGGARPVRAGIILVE